MDKNFLHRTPVVQDNVNIQQTGFYEIRKLPHSKENSKVKRHPIF